MDKDTLREHLAQADKHVALGKRQVHAQRERIAELERDGHDASSAKHRLAQSALLESMYISERDDLRRELTVDDR